MVRRSTSDQEVSNWRHLVLSLRRTLLVKLRKKGKGPDMTEKLLTGMCSININKTICIGCSYE